MIPILQEHGHTVIAVQLNLRSLAGDVAWTRHVLAERVAPGPTVLAGHSYGARAGAPAGRVIGLVFASAFAPKAGESLGQLGAMFPPPPALAHLQPDSQGFLWFDPAAFSTNFAQDLPLEQAQVAAAAQRPGTAALFSDLAGPAAWKTVPSWALVSTQDRAINPDLLRFMARRAKAKTIEVASSHASILSHSCEVRPHPGCSARRRRMTTATVQRRTSDVREPLGGRLRRLLHGKPLAAAMTVGDPRWRDRSWGGKADG